MHGAGQKHTRGRKPPVPSLRRSTTLVQRSIEPGLGEFLHLDIAWACWQEPTTELLAEVSRFESAFTTFPYLSNSVLMAPSSCHTSLDLFCKAKDRNPIWNDVNNAARLVGPAMITRWSRCSCSNSPGWRNTSAYKLSVGMNRMANSNVSGGLIYLLLIYFAQPLILFSRSRRNWAMSLLSPAVIASCRWSFPRGEISSRWAAAPDLHHQEILLHTRYDSHKMEKCSTDKEKAICLSVILSDGEIVVFVVRAELLLYI